MPKLGVSAPKRSARSERSDAREVAEPTRRARLRPGHHGRVLVAVAPRAAADAATDRPTRIGASYLEIGLNYLNEFDPVASAWLRELRDAGLIPPCDIDTRSIEDVKPNDLRGYTQCHFFAGISGWPLALQLAGWPADRPIWTGSCPCQPFSAAGKGDGFADERHLWPAWYWLIEQCRPAVVVGEQVASAAVGPWIDLVLTDLEALGYASGAYAGPAAGVGAKHVRQRSYWAALAHPVGYEQPRQEPRGGSHGRVGRLFESVSWDEPWQSALSRFRIVGDGLPRFVGGTDGARNAIVPQQAAQFIQALMEYQACSPN